MQPGVPQGARPCPSSDGGEPGLRWVSGVGRAKHTDPPGPPHLADAAAGTSAAQPRLQTLPADGHALQLSVAALWSLGGVQSRGRRFWMSVEHRGERETTKRQRFHGQVQKPAWREPVAGSTCPASLRCPRGSARLLTPVLCVLQGETRAAVPWAEARPWQSAAAGMDPARCPASPAPPGCPRGAGRGGAPRGAAAECPPGRRLPHLVANKPLKCQGAIPRVFCHLLAKFRHKHLDFTLGAVFSTRLLGLF